MTEAKQGHYSQSNEQEIITSYFQEKGRFLDIGAYDGVTFSNVYQLVLDGWEGISIEPSPVAFAKLMKNYSGTKINLVNALIGDGGVKEFHDSLGDALSTTEQSQVEIWKGYSEFQKIFIPSLSIKTVMDAFPQFCRSFDFINVDTEGTSLEIFKQVLRKLSFRMICVEHDGKPEHIEIITSLGEAHSLRVLATTGENIILAE